MRVWIEVQQSGSFICQTLVMIGVVITIINFFFHFFNVPQMKKYKFNSFLSISMNERLISKVSFNNREKQAYGGVAHIKINKNIYPKMKSRKIHSIYFDAYQPGCLINIRVMSAIIIPRLLTARKIFSHFSLLIKKQQEKKTQQKFLSNNNNTFNFNIIYFFPFSFSPWAVNKQ